MQIQSRITTLRGWLKGNADLASAAFFLTLLVSPALLELLIVRPSQLRELIVLGISFLLFAAAGLQTSRRIGLTWRHVGIILRTGGRLPELILFTCWIAILGMQALAGRGENAHIPFGYFAFFFAVYLVDLYFAVTGRQGRQLRILYLLIAVFAVASFRGMFVLAAQPMVAREMSTGSFPEASRHFYHLLGVGGFEFFTGLGCVFPMLVYYRMTASRRRTMTVLLVLVLLGLLFAGYTLAIVFTGLGLFVLLVYSLVRLRGPELKALIRICLLLLLVILLFLALGHVFHLYQSQLYLMKIVDVARIAADRVLGIELRSYNPPGLHESLVEMGSSSEERLDLYTRSIRTFLDAPLLGVGSRVNTGDFTQVGGHSTWLDYLAMYGLLWFTPFVLFYILLFRRLHRMIASKAEKAYRMTSFLIYTLYGLVNPVIATAVFPVVLLFFVTGRVILPGEASLVPSPAALPRPVSPSRE